MEMATNKKRLRWACRRGMLELDIILNGFLDEGYDDLTPREQQLFCELLKNEDDQLFRWFMGHVPCQDQHLKTLIQRIVKGSL